MDLVETDNKANNRVYADGIALVRRDRDHLAALAFAAAVHGGRVARQLVHREVCIEFRQRLLRMPPG